MSRTSRAAAARRVQLEGALGLARGVDEIACLEPPPSQLDLRVDHRLGEVSHLGRLRGRRAQAPRRGSGWPGSPLPRAAPGRQPLRSRAVGRPPFAGVGGFVWGRAIRLPRSLPERDAPAGDRGGRGPARLVRRLAPPARDRRARLPQRHKHLARVLEALRRVLGSALSTACTRIGGRSGANSTIGGGSSCITLKSTPCIDSASKGLWPLKQLVEDAAEREHVGARVGLDRRAPAPGTCSAACPSPFRCWSCRSRPCAPARSP